jgi:hypothetical protein
MRTPYTIGYKAVHCKPMGCEWDRPLESGIGRIRRVLTLVRQGSSPNLPLACSTGQEEIACLRFE